MKELVAEKNELLAKITKLEVSFKSKYLSNSLRKKLMKIFPHHFKTQTIKKKDTEE